MNSFMEPEGFDEDPRSPREFSEREAQKENDSWLPPSLLPSPAPRKGWKFRWIRTSFYGQSDVRNVSSRFREGWSPVLAKDFPELKIMSDRNSDFPENIEVGGLLLCMAPTELVERRNEYYRQRSRNQIESIDTQYLRTSDPRMPLSAPERRTQVQLGKKTEET